MDDLGAMDRLVELYTLVVISVPLTYTCRYIKCDNQLVITIFMTHGFNSPCGTFFAVVNMYQQHVEKFVDCYVSYVARCQLDEECSIQCCLSTRCGDLNVSRAGLFIE